MNHPAQRASQKGQTDVRCPRCGHWKVRKWRIRGSDIQMYLCHECEATWLRKDWFGIVRYTTDPEEPGFHQFGPFMARNGCRYSLEELEPETMDLP